MIANLLTCLLTAVCFISLIQTPILCALDSPERTSALEKRQQLLDRFCIGICPKGPIGTEDIKDGAVTNPKLADNAVTTDKIVDGAITGSKVQGISKLIFGDCGRFEDITLDPGERIIGLCLPPPGIEIGDKVVTTLNPIRSPPNPSVHSFCFGVVDSEVREHTEFGLRVFVTFNNECDFTATETFTVGMIVYQTI